MDLLWNKPLRLLTCAVILFTSQPIAAQANWRGANVTVDVDAAGLSLLKSWNVNMLRIQMLGTRDPSSTPGTAAYHWEFLNAIHSDVTKVRANILPWCKANGIRVILDLHTHPGVESDSCGDLIKTTRRRLFNEAWAQDLFQHTWHIIGQGILRNAEFDEVVWGVDLLNEPHGKDSKWRPLAQQAINNIRTYYSTNTRIVIESRHASPDLLAQFAPLSGSRLWYSFHFYAPLAYTHQESGLPPSAYVSYPGQIGGGPTWNRSRIRTQLAIVRQWQLQHNAKVYVGEFAAMRWVPNSDRYMRDCIRVFEENDWNWTYHIFREHHSWNVEQNPMTLDMLKSYFALN